MCVYICSSTYIYCCTCVAPRATSASVSFERHVYMHTNIRIYIYIYIYIYMHTQTQTHRHTQICACVNTQTHIPEDRRCPSRSHVHPKYESEGLKSAQKCRSICECVCMGLSPRENILISLKCEYESEGLHTCTKFACQSVNVFAWV